MTAVSVFTADWRPATPTNSVPLLSWNRVVATRRLAGNDWATVDRHTFNLDEVSAVTERTRDLFVLADGGLRFRGRLLAAPQDLSADGWTGKVEAVDYGGWLDNRNVDAAQLTFAQVDQGDIGWGLVDHVQGVTGGALGITRGSITAGTPRDRTYERGKNIVEALDQLGAVIGGGDWWVTPDRQFCWACPRRGVDTGRHLDVASLGGQNLRIVGTGRTLANAVWASGGEGTTPVQALAPGDPDTWPEGRLDLYSAYSDVVEQSTLADKAAALVSKRGEQTWSWTMPWSSAETSATDIGDIAVLVARLPGGFIAEQPARLVERSLVATADGRVDAVDRWLAEPPVTGREGRWRCA